MNQPAPSHQTLLPEEPQEDRVELLEYWRGITRRKWSVIGLTLAITLLAAVIVHSITPVYRATATILLETGKSKVVSVEEVYTGMSANREFFQTQAEIMRSRELVSKVVAKLKLGNHPELDPRRREPSLWQKWTAPLGLEPDTKVDITDEMAEKSAVGQFMGRLSAEPAKGSSMLRVSFEAEDRELAARAANAVADAFIENDLEARFQLTQ